MGHSINSQLKYAVHNSFKAGRSKHAEKIRDSKWQERGASWSYETKFDRLDCADRLGQYIKEHYPNTKLAKDIRIEQIQAYLSDCKRRGLTQATLDAYASNCRAICRELKRTYSGCQMNEREITTPTAIKAKIRDHQMPERARKCLQQSENENVKIAGALSAAFGLRAKEMTKVRPFDIYEVDGEVFCHVERGKGNRNREVKAFNHERGRLTLEIARNRADKECLINIKDKSLERAVSRELERNNMHERYIGLHAARKTWAQETYDQYRQEHSKYETVGYVNEQLGHSAERDQELLDKYVHNAW